jgi:hypothetical protein
MINGIEFYQTNNDKNLDRSDNKVINQGDMIKLGIHSTEEGFSEPIEWYVLKTNGTFSTASGN